VFLLFFIKNCTKNASTNSTISTISTILDMNHCFFSDRVPVQFCDECQSDNFCSMKSNACTKPSTHRKLIAYWRYSDVEFVHTLTSEHIHGTHTSGSIAGKSMDADQMNVHSGQAPDAKLIFTQLTSSSKKLGSLDLPADLYRYKLYQMYSLNGLFSHISNWISNFNELFSIYFVVIIFHLVII
jgi:hypothetical protein